MYIIGNPFLRQFEVGSYQSHFLLVLTFLQVDIGSSVYGVCNVSMGFPSSQYLNLWDSGSSHWSEAIAERVSSSGEYHSDKVLTS